MSSSEDGAVGLSGPFDEYSDNYTKALEAGLAVSGESQEFFAQQRIRWVARCLSEIGFRARRVLDFGCGQGASTPLLIEALGASVAVGVDVSRGLLQIASASNADRRISYAVSTETAPDESFDCAYTNGVIHHIPVHLRPGVMQYIHDSLAPGGLFALWENNPWNLGTRYVMRRIPFDRDAVTLTIFEARRLVSESGFEIIRTDSLFFFPRFFRVFRRLEPVLSKTWLGAQYLVLCRKPDVEAQAAP